MAPGGGLIGGLITTAGVIAMLTLDVLRRRGAAAGDAAANTDGSITDSRRSSGWMSKD